MRAIGIIMGAVKSKLRRNLAGIDVKSFSAHSTRGASTSFAKKQGATIEQVVEAGKGDRRVERDDDRHRHRLQEDQQGLNQVEPPRLARFPQRIGRDKTTPSASGVGSP